MDISEELKELIKRNAINRAGSYKNHAMEFKRFVQEHLRYSVDMTCPRCIFTWTEKAYHYLKEKGEI